MLLLILWKKNGDFSNFGIYKQESRIPCTYCASGIALGDILTQPREGNIDHPIYFSIWKISNTKHKYTTSKCKALAMVYSLKKHWHYLLGGNFKIFTNHSALKYIVNKPMIEGIICRWLLMFKEFSFEFIVKLGWINVGLNCLSQLESGGSEGSVDVQLPNVDFFRIKVVPKYLEDIALFLTTSKCLANYFTTQKRHLVVRETDYQLIIG